MGSKEFLNIVFGWLKHYRPYTPEQDYGLLITKAILEGSCNHHNLLEYTRTAKGLARRSQDQVFTKTWSKVNQRVTLKILGMMPTPRQLQHRPPTVL